MERFADPVYAYLRSRLMPRTELADDLAQEVFLIAWEKLGNFRGTASLESWLLGIARHKVEDHYRAQLRAPLELDDLPIDPADAAALAFDETMDREALETRIRTVMTGLPEDYATALLWRYWEKTSTRDIAARTGRTEKSVERLLARARDQFKKRWNHA